MEILIDGSLEHFDYHVDFRRRAQSAGMLVVMLSLLCSLHGGQGKATLGSFGGLGALLEISRYVAQLFCIVPSPIARATCQQQ